MQTPKKLLVSHKNYANLFKKLFREPKKIQMQFCDYFRWFFQFHRKLQGPKKKQILFSSSKVKQRLDVIYILNKLVEIDKLKLLLLNTDQLKLFEYLPKPVVTTKNDSMTCENEI